MEANIAALNAILYVNDGSPMMSPLSKLGLFGAYQNQDSICLQKESVMSSDDDCHLRNPSKAETNEREGDCRAGCNQYQRQPPVSSFLYQALFSADESSTTQGSERSFHVTVEPQKKFNWTHQQNYPPSSHADSGDWSSFSDISNTISPAASNYSVAVSWKSSEAEPVAVSEQFTSEPVSQFEAAPVDLSLLRQQFEPSSSVPQPSSVINDKECKGRAEETEVKEEKTLESEACSQNPLPARRSPITVNSQHPQRAMTLNNECFDAAINERTRGNLRGKIMTKLKQMRAERQLQSAAPDTTKHRHDHYHQSEQQDHLHHHHHHHHQQQQQQQQSDLHLQSIHCSSMLTETSVLQPSLQCMTSSTMAIYMAPESPSATSQSSDTSASSAKSINKKYRYNQTAAALQKSGLLKTTVRTAELLQRNKELQGELQKLRRETMVFMQSVLANPENQHLRKLYLTQGIS